MTVEEEMIDRSKGNGSRTAMEDEKTGDLWASKDQRAATKTTYYTSDIDSLHASPTRKKQLKRMLRFQEGEQVNVPEFDSRGQQNHKEDKRRMVSVLCSQLSMTDVQTERVKHLIMDVMDINSFGPYSFEQVIIGTINVVAREDERWIEDEPQFREFLMYVDISKDDGSPDIRKLRRLRTLVRERIPSHSV
jgi:hypothetical protein